MTTFLKVKNRAVSTLASGISDSDVSLTVAAGQGAKFPSTFPFHITIENEILECTNRSTDVLTVTRAAEGTSAAAHSAGVTVSLNITAKHISDLAGAVNTLEGGVLFSKAKIETRDSTAASGDVSYTGYGFRPTTLEILMATDEFDDWSVGFADSAGTSLSLIQRRGNTRWLLTAVIAKYDPSSGNSQEAILQSYDADGFTLTWTKLGTPTSTTMRLAVRALR